MGSAGATRAIAEVHISALAPAGELAGAFADVEPPMLHMRVKYTPAPI
jgi:hypothetical protein